MSNEKPDALYNGNGNGGKKEKLAKGAPMATRVVGSFDHPLLPMTPVSVATHTRGSIAQGLAETDGLPGYRFLELLCDRCQRSEGINRLAPGCC